MTDSQVEGVVLNGTGGIWNVWIMTERREVPARLLGRVKHESDTKLAVGDRVHLVPDERNASMAIGAILPRISTLSRRRPGGYGERIVASNLSQVLVVLAMVKPEPNLRMLDRFLVIAEANDIAARIVMNKIDLASEDEARAFIQAYSDIGYDVYPASTKTGAGLEELRASLQQNVSAFTGPSGVGKSSLLNAIYPGMSLRVGEISESVNKGRHTTVGAWMVPLPDGGFVVDTPGLREVGLWGLASESLDQCFPEFRGALGECHFGDCRHVAEPKCAVRQLVTTGAVTDGRYGSYCDLLGEIQQDERDAQP